MNGREGLTCLHHQLARTARSASGLSRTTTRS